MVLVSKKSYVFDDSTDFIKRALKDYPPATNEENVELIRLIRLGNEEAKDLICYKNLKLILFAMRQCQRKYHNLQDADLIQEGFAGLLAAVNGYDESYNGFTAYAVKSIISRIKIAVDTKEALIKRSTKFLLNERKYIHYIRNLQDMRLPLPDDDKIKMDLDITQTTLDRIRVDLSLDVVSLSEPVSQSDDESSSLEEFVENPKNEIAGSFTSLYTKECLAFLKTNLSPLEYFIVYSRIFSENILRPTDLSNIFRFEYFSSYNYYEANIFAKLRECFDPKTGDFKGYIDKDTRRLLYSGYFNENPITPESITRFLFLRDYLDELEKEVYKEMYFSNIKFLPIVASKKLGISTETVLEKVESINEKAVRFIDASPNIYEEFQRNILDTYNTKIYDVDWNMDLSEFRKNYAVIYDEWKDKTYEDLLSMVNEENIPSDIREKVKSFLGHIDFNEKGRVNISRVEEKINCLIRGVYNSSDVPKSKLLKAFNRHRASYSELIRDSVSVFFGNMTRNEFATQHNGNVIIDYSDRIYGILHSVYFNLRDYRTMDFDNALYSRIKKSCKSKIPVEVIKTLDFYFSCDIKNASRDTANYLKVDNNEVSQIISGLKIQAINAYLGRSATIEVDYNIYRDFLKKNVIDLGEPTNTILRMIFFEKKTYDEIAKKLKLSNQKISVYFSQGLRRIDCSRFGIFLDEQFSKVMLANIVCKSVLSNNIKEALLEYIDTMDGEEVSKKYGISLKDLSSHMTKIKNVAYQDSIKDIQLEYREIKKEISASEPENILSVLQRYVLSLYFGIENCYNPLMEKLNVKEIAERLKITCYLVTSSKDKALDLLKAKKIGIDRAQYDFIKKAELREFLQDSYVPLEDRDKDLLNRLYGIDCKSVTLEEYCRENDVNIRTTRARLYNAVITLRKYQNREIEGNIPFEEGIEPYLKYFSLRDRKIIMDLMLYGLSYEKVQKKYGYSKSEFITLALNIRVYLKDLQTGYPPGFDFDFYYENVLKDDVPFYGDKKLAMHLFHLFYEEGKSIKSIIEEDYPDLNDAIIRRIILYLEIAVMKYKEKIKKTFEFSYEEVRSYYLCNHQNMSLRRKQLFSAYFNKSKRKYVSVGRNLSDNIIRIMLKDRDDYIRLKDLNQNEFKKIINSYFAKLSKREQKIFMLRFKIHPRDFMKGKDKRQVLDYLYDISISREKNKTMQIRPKE